MKIDSRKSFDWKDHDINQAYLKFLGKYGFVFIDFKGRIRRFPNKNDNMNGNATDLSGTKASPEAKASVVGGVSCYPLSLPALEGSPYPSPKVPGRRHSRSQISKKKEK